MNKSNLLVVLCGPSGVGKSSIIKQINYPTIKSYTTREPRNEDDNYNFIDYEEFQEKINNNFFFEYNKVFGNWYGRSYDDINQPGTYIIDMDMCGIKYLKNLSISSKVIYISVEPPSIDILFERIKNRDSEVDQDRIKRAKDEIAYGKNLDYQVINNDLNITVDEISSIISNHSINWYY